MEDNAAIGDVRSDPRVAEILDIVAKETAVDRERLTPETTITSLDIASLDMVQAIFALETRYDIEVPVVTNEAGGEFSTVGDLVRHVIATIDAKPEIDAKPGIDAKVGGDAKPAGDATDIGGGKALG